jgi:hypothetical protein
MPPDPSGENDAGLDSRRGNPSLYVGADGLPTLKRSFSIYLDALGTRKAMASMNDHELRQQLELLRLRWFLHNEDWATDRQRLMSFSDNLVVGSPIAEQDPGGQGLGMLLSSVQGYQLNLAARNRFLRGAIALGDLYMDDRLVTGQALVDAVDLEESVAVYPRVVLSGACVALALADVEGWFWNDQLLVDADGQVIVNYLTAIADDEIPGEVEAGLAAHRRAIETKLSEFATAGRIREKYRWVADYHNYVRREYFPDVVGYDVEAGLLAVERRYTRQFSAFAP